MDKREIVLIGNSRGAKSGDLRTVDAERAEELVSAGLALYPSSSQSDSPARVEDILAEVGDDKEKAKAALDAERKDRGDKARKTLVEPLEKILTAEPVT